MMNVVFVVVITQHVQIAQEHLMVVLLQITVEHVMLTLQMIVHKIVQVNGEDLHR